MVVLQLETRGTGPPVSAPLPVSMVLIRNPQPVQAGVGREAADYARNKNAF
jgi:hypothetical protein